MTAKVITLDAAARRKTALLKARREAAMQLLSWRESQGLTQTEAAHSLGVGVRQYGEWERGGVRMPAEVLVLTREAA